MWGISGGFGGGLDRYRGVDSIDCIVALEFRTTSYLVTRSLKVC